MNILSTDQERYQCLNMSNLYRYAQFSQAQSHKRYVSFRVSVLYIVHMKNLTVCRPYAGNPQDISGNVEEISCTYNIMCSRFSHDAFCLSCVQEMYLTHQCSCAQEMCLKCRLSCVVIFSFSYVTYPGHRKCS